MSVRVGSWQKRQMVRRFYTWASRIRRPPARGARRSGRAKIWHEKVSGAIRDRPELTWVMEYVREGDTLVVASMDRLARSVPDLYAIVEELNGRGVAVRFLKEGQRYDAHSDATSQLMLGMLGVVAQFERALIRERQAEGIARAKARGVYDRVPAMSKDEIQQARDLIALGVPKAEVASPPPGCQQKHPVQVRRHARPQR